MASQGEMVLDAFLRFAHSCTVTFSGGAGSVVPRSFLAFSSIDCNDRYLDNSEEL